MADIYRPTFFELVASDQLRSLLSPAVRYTLSVLAQRNPRLFLRLFNNFDEVWAGFMLLVQRHYLRTWSAGFEENFYGLKRRRRPGLEGTRLPPRGSSSKRNRVEDRLSRLEVNSSIFFLVGLPYLQQKLHSWWERNGGGVDESLFGDEEEHDSAGAAHSRSTWTGHFERHQPQSRLAHIRHRIGQLRSLFSTGLFKSYPYLSTFWQMWVLSYHIRYLFDHTPYWRPWLSFFRIEVRRVGPGDYAEQSQIPLLPPDLPNPLRSPREFIARLVRGAPYMGFESLKYLLPASIFFFKFLEWWYSSDNPRSRRAGDGALGTGGPSFGAPKPLLPGRTGVSYRHLADWKDPQVTLEAASMPESSSHSESETDTGPPTPTGYLIHNSCPLCGTTPMNNPAILPTGYAFCYTCANGYVETQGKCPVTGARVLDGTDGIRRVLG